MRLPVGQLKKFIDLGPANLEEVVEQLTQIGIEVEEVVEYGSEISGITIGQVKEKNAHPNADKLNYCSVDTGAGEDLKIVCGADNFKTGDKVAVATLGGTLPGGFKMKKTKIRGLESEGMICASDELGIDSDHSGIMVLDENAPVGSDFKEYFKLKDHVLELELTANRGDHLSVRGIARDLAAKSGRRFLTDESSPTPGTAGETLPCSLEIQSASGCNRYLLKTFSNTRNRVSPYWLKIELSKLGLRPINQVVDITNFLLFQLGNPMHAFDLDKLEGKKIIVRYAVSGETLKTLDERIIHLDSSDLVIADAVKPVALAGIMGGFDTQVDMDTKNIALEMAHFDPVLIRKTSKKYGFHTDSSHRFERFVDPESIPGTVAEAIRLLSEISSPDPGFIDLYPHPLHNPDIVLRMARLNAIIGHGYAFETVKNILSGLCFKIVDEETDNWIKVQVPSFRLFDISREIDLIEEIVRINGYNSFPPKFSKVSMPLGKYHGFRAMIRRLKSNLSGLNIDESMSFSFGSEDYFKQFSGPDFPFAILKNPLSEEYATMRPMLFPNILSAVRKNQDLGISGIQFYEIGKVFAANQGSFHEDNVLSIVMTDIPPSDFWNMKPEINDFFSLKGVIDQLFGFVEGNLTFTQGNEPFFHPGINAEIHFNGKKAGFAGKLHPALCKESGLDCNIFIAEINLSSLVQRLEFLPKFTNISKYPGAERDIAIVVPKNIPFSSVENCIQEAGGIHLKWIKVFDYYEGEHVDAYSRSIAIRMFFQSDEKTLKEKEINKSFSKIESALLEKLNISKRIQ